MSSIQSAADRNGVVASSPPPNSETMNGVNGFPTSNGAGPRRHSPSSSSSSSAGIGTAKEVVADLYEDLDDSARRGSGYRSIGDAKTTKSERLAQAGFWSTLFTIVKNVVNAGFLSLPIALVYASFIPAIFVLVISYLFNTYTFILMARCCHEEKVYSYRDLWEVAFGNRYYGPFLIDMLMFLFTLGGTVVIVILIGDFGVFVQNFCDVDSLCANMVFQKILVTTVILLPLSLLRDLYHLRFSSALGLMCIFYTAIYISANTQVDFGEPEQKPEFFHIKLEITQALALFNTAFTCHYNAPRYFEEFKGHDIKRFSILSVVAYSIIACFYAWVAIVPYFRFGGNTQGNVLNNYPAEADGTFDGDGVVAARLGMLLSVTMTFPIIMNGLRFAVVRMIWSKDDQDPDAAFRIPLPSWWPKCGGGSGSRSGSRPNSPKHSKLIDDEEQRQNYANGVGQKTGGDAAHKTGGAGAAYAPVFSDALANVESDDEDEVGSARYGSSGHRRRALRVPRYWPIVFVFTALTLVLGIVFTDISDVNTLRGSVLGMFIMYMLPVGIYMRLGQIRGRKRSWFDTIMCVVTFFFGLVTGVLGILSLAGVV